MSKRPSWLRGEVPGWWLAGMIRRPAGWKSALDSGGSASKSSSPGPAGGYSRWFGLCWQIAMAELGPELRAELGREDWQLLFDRVVRIAETQSNWLRWRGSKEGVMPDGNEAKSIANEAIGELFAGNCRLGMPYTREELDKEF